MTSNVSLPSEVTKHNKKAVLLKLFIIISVAMSAVCAVLRLMSLLYAYNPETAYYLTDSILPTVSNTAFVITAVFIALIALLLLPRATKDTAASIKPPHAVPRVAALVVAAVIAALAIMRISDVLKNAVYPPDIWDAITIAVMIVSVFFYFSLWRKDLNPNFTVAYGICHVLWCILLWVSSYLDFFIPMNSPDKIFFELACMALALLAVSEMRAIYEHVKPRMYIFSLLFAILSLSVSSIPSIVFNYAVGFRKYTLLDADIIFLACAIYAAVRAFYLARNASAIYKEAPAQSNIADADQAIEQAQEAPDTDIADTCEEENKNECE